MPQSAIPASTNVKVILERELRFVPVDRLPISTVTTPTWRTYRTTVLPDERHLTTYFETPTQALARQGITFRRRVYLDPSVPDDRPIAAELTLKLPRAAAAGHLFARPEYTEPIDPDAPLIGHALQHIVAEYTPGELIEPWFISRTLRAGFALHQDDVLIYLTWDRLMLPADPAYDDAELEAELVTGPIEALDDLAQLLVTTYGLAFGDNGKRTRAGRHLARLGLITFPA